MYVFLVDSVLMPIYMTPAKIAKVIDLCSNLLQAQSPKIRKSSQVIYSFCLISRIFQKIQEEKATVI